MRYTKHKYYVYMVLFLISFSHIYPQSVQDLQKMRAEYEKFQKGKTDLQIPIDAEIDPLTGLPKQATIVPYQFEIEEDSLTTQLKHFGYEFFVQRDTLKFWENLPAPSNYLLGPGDELVVSLWGETQLRETYTITRDGKIYDQKVGLLNPMGKTIDEAQKYLKNQFGRVYSTLNGQSPSTYMDISLGQLRSMNVNFVGEVKYPGVYPVHPFSTVITGLIQAGGVDTTGSLRNIRIKRDDQIYAIIDLYDYLLKGDLPKNIQLRDQDIVIVPVRQSTVTVDSAVVRPGIYESKNGEMIHNIIDYAGGLRSNASSSIGLIRIIPLSDRDNSKVNTENYYIDYSNIQKTPVMNGDIITVRKIFDSLSQVEIIGQVKNPGIYYYYQGMKLKDLIALGGGFKDTTFLKSVYQIKGELVRRNPNSRYEKVIDVDLRNVIDEKEEKNIDLENLDRFVVHANRNFFERENVQIMGEVNVPGAYPLISDKETLNSLLNRAGGLTNNALKDGVAIYREKKYFDERSPQRKFVDKSSQSLITEPLYYSKNNSDDENDNWIRVAWKNENIILMAGDSVVVKETTGTVNITGEVYNPGLIEYQKGKSLHYYIDSAGGVTTDGDKKDVIVIYANGVVIPKKFLKSPRIQDGATIVVNQKENKEPFDLTAFASSVLSIISTSVTILVLSQQIN